MNKKFPIWVLVLIIFVIGIVNGVAGYWHLYFYYRWLDIPMHLLGGFWVGLTTLAIYYFSKFIPTKKYDTSSIFAISIGAALVIGVGWEAFEWGVDQITGLKHLDMIDTLSDIGNDVIGAVVAGVIFIRKGYNK